MVDGREIVTCQNYKNTEKEKLTYISYRDCGNCPWLYTHKAQSWRDDEVKCRAKAFIRFGDTVEIIPEDSRNLSDEDVLLTQASWPGKSLAKVNQGDCPRDYKPCTEH